MTTPDVLKIYEWIGMRRWGLAIIETEHVNVGLS